MIIALYNTCGLSGRKNTYYWIKAVTNLLKQQVDEEVKVVISDCCSPKEWMNELYSCLGDEVDYVHYDEILPLNRTVNLSARKYPNANAYLYLDSGINFDTNYGALQAMKDEMTKDIAMVAAQVDTDGGYSLWGLKQPGIIPIGKTVNLHCHLFSGEYFKAYNAILPDIFASDTSESVFTYLCAAIGKKFVLHPTLRVHHEAYMDGASCGFKRGSVLWKSPKSIKQLCEEGYPLGFGYEECYDPMTGTGHVLDHNPNLYKDGMPIYKEDLYTWMKENLFVKQ